MEIAGRRAWVGPATTFEAGTEGVKEVSEMIRVGHFSDLHYCERKLDEADRCFGYAIDEAIRRGIDAAVISGDTTDHALDVHNPAVVRLMRRVQGLANHCPVLMLQGTFSHEPPGMLSIFPLLAARHAVHVADRIGQVALTQSRTWIESAGPRFDTVPAGAAALFICVPTVNKAALATATGAADVATAQGQEIAALLAGYVGIHRAAKTQGVPTIGVSHGTVSGCVTEHGVPMAGLDHEFTTGALFAAGAQAFMLGHIHSHQSWEQDGCVVAYAGSIGRFHHGEIGDKGFLLWEVDASAARFELVTTPARRTVDIVFDGRPDFERIRASAENDRLRGAHVRVRWLMPEEERHEVDRAAIRRLLAGAAEVRFEERVVSVVRSRAEGISRCVGLVEEVKAWARVTETRPEPLLECLAQVVGGEPALVASKVLAGESADRTGVAGRGAAAVEGEGAERARGCNGVPESIHVDTDVAASVG